MVAKKIPQEAASSSGAPSRWLSQDCWSHRFGCTLFACRIVDVQFDKFDHLFDQFWISFWSFIKQDMQVLWSEDSSEVASAFHAHHKCETRRRVDSFPGLGQATCVFCTEALDPDAANFGHKLKVRKLNRHG